MSCVECVQFALANADRADGYLISDPEISGGLGMARFVHRVKGGVVEKEGVCVAV